MKILLKCMAYGACAAGAAAGLAFALRRGRLPRAVRVGRRKAAFR